MFRELDANPDLLLIGGVVTQPVPGVPETPVGEKYPDQVIWVPVSEFAAMSMGTGAAMGGLRTLVPIGTASFVFYGWPVVTLEAPNVRYKSGGTVCAPVTFYMTTGHGRLTGPSHEHTPEVMLQNIPGLRVYAPGTPAEVDAVLHKALTCNDPTVIADHVHLGKIEGAVPDSPLDPDAPQVVRDGSDVVVVARSFMLHHALQAAAAVEHEGVSVAVLSTPLINPAPIDEILEKLSAFERIVFVDESRAAGSVASHLMARALDADLRFRGKLVCTLPAPSPFAKHLSDAIVPTPDRIGRAIRELVADRPKVSS